MILIDTSLVSPEQRIGYWQQSVDRWFRARVLVGITTNEPFQARLRVLRIERIDLIEMAGEPMELSADATTRRTTITALAVLRGSVVLKQDDRECAVSAGELILYASDEATELAVSTAAHVAAVSVPASEFLNLFPRGREALFQAIPAAQGAPALFVDQLNALMRCAGPLSAGSASAVASSMVFLLGSVACFAVADTPSAAHRTRERIQRVLKFARSRLRDPDLDVETIARAVHLSPRQVHRLFSAEPMSLMHWVVKQRLHNCYRELEQPGLQSRSISEIAYDWGFNDQAHFSRAFRKEFGRSPSEVRRTRNAASENATQHASAGRHDIPECEDCHFRTSKTSD